jgi:hypothetical protein
MTIRARTAIPLALILSLALAVSARAGQYTIHNCPGSLQPNFDAGPWQSYSNAPLPSVGGFQGSCTPGSTLGTAIGWYANEQSLNTNLGAMLQSPVPGITIREMRLVWSVSHQSSGSDTYAQITSPGSELIDPTPYVVGTSNPAKVLFPNGTRTVYVYSYCSYDGSTNCYFPSGVSPVTRIEGMDTTLEEANPPTATINGGSLASGGPVSGTATLQFTANDGESGVRESQLLVDGTPVLTDNYSSQCTYANFAACPQSQTNSMAWDTNKIANGEHQVALRITDAAGDTQTVDNHLVLIANEVVPAGEGPPPPPCAAVIGTHTTITVTARHHLLVSNYHARAHLNGKLLEPGNKPIADAAVEVLARPTVGSNEFLPLGHITTRANGHFTTILPVGVSRTICLRYRPLPGGRYAAALAVTQQVRAGVSLAVHPHGVESNGTIILSGAVLGGFIPAVGKVAELQVHYLGSWRVFRTLRTSPRGGFTSFYSFLGGQGTFAFRACVRNENDYPFILGCSRPVSVRAG